MKKNGFGSETRRKKLDTSDKTNKTSMKKQKKQKRTT